MEEEIVFVPRQKQIEKPKEVTKPRDYRTQDEIEQERIVNEELQSEPQETVQEQVVDQPKQVEETPILQERETIPVVTEKQDSREKYLHGFRVIEEIGVGGVSQVFRVKQESTGAEFAYKTVNPRAPLDIRSTLESLLREEATLINQMNGERNFPTFAIDFTTETEDRGFVTEYIPHAIEDKIGELDSQTALNYFEQAANAINSLHKKQIVLADIKPSQYRLDENGNLKLVDLNLKHTEDETHKTSSIVHSIAHSMIQGSKVKGTPRYMAPEQWELLEGKEAVIDRRTDVFQLGSLLYELVSGIKPEGHYEDLQGELAPLNDVVKKARQRQQVNRYQTVEELLQDFRDKTQTKAITTRQQTLEQKAQAVETEKYEAGTLETAREASSSLYKIIKGTLKGTLDFVKPFFIFPTRVRKGLDENEPKFSAVQVLGMPLMGCLANFANGIATVGTYIDEGGSDYWKFGIIPIATNLASGAYEFWRHCRNKIVEKKRTFQTSLSPQEKELAKLKQYNPFEQSRVIADYIINELRGSTPSDFTRVKSKQSEGFDITIDDKKIAEIVANRVYIDSANSSVQEIVSKAREKLKIYIETTESYEYERRLSSVNNSDGLDRGRVIGDYLVDRLSRLSQNRYKVERKSQHAREYVVLLGNKEIATIDDERVIYVHDEHLFERIKRIAEESKGEYKVHVGQAFKVPN